MARLATPDNAQTAQTRKMFAEITFMGNARPANLAPEITHLLAVSSEPREVVAKVKIACSRTSTPTSRLLQGLAQPLRQLTTRRVTTTQEPSEDVKAAVVEAVDDEKVQHARKPQDQPQSSYPLQHRQRRENRSDPPLRAETLDLRTVTSDGNPCDSARKSTSLTLLSCRRWYLLVQCTATCSTVTRTKSEILHQRAPRKTHCGVHENSQKNSATKTPGQYPWPR